MATASIRCLGRVGVIALAFVASAAQALDQVEFLVATPDKNLTRALRDASVVLAGERDKRTDVQDLLTNSRAEYAALLNTLYARGHYSAVIHVYADGREVASIPPLDSPRRIDHIKITVEPGPLFALSRASVRPLPPRPELPEGFRSGTGRRQSADDVPKDQGWLYQRHGRPQRAEANRQHRAVACLRCVTDTGCHCCDK